MERETGIEPATNSLEGCDSTIELLPQSSRAASPCHAIPIKPAGLSGAGERTRTPDRLITNQMLYQLSYAGPNEPNPIISPAREIRSRRLGVWVKPSNCPGINCSLS